MNTQFCEYTSPLNGQKNAKEIMLRVNTLQEYKDSEPEVIDLITEGLLYEKKDSLYLTYDESEISGIANNKVILKVKGSEYVKMNRFGEFETEMLFKEKKRDVSIYSTPYGEFRVEILTDKVDVDLQDSMGDVYVEYTVAVSGSTEVKNKLTISYYEE